MSILFDDLDLAWVCRLYLRDVTVAGYQTRGTYVLVWKILFRPTEFIPFFAPDQYGEYLIGVGFFKVEESRSSSA
jgi:hypothetical protein